MKNITTILLIFTCCTLSYSQDSILYKGQYYQVIPLPTHQPSEFIGTSSDSSKQHFVQYNLKDRTQSILPTPDSGNNLIDQRFVNGQKGAVPSDTIPEVKPRSFNVLTRINNTQSFPWQRNVKLFMTSANDNRYVCSGTLVDACFVLTAGHCLFSHDDGGWMTTIEVVPAYNEGEAPFGTANATSLYSWSGWTTFEDFDWDMGVIQLDRPVGALTGWRGYGFNDSNSYFSNSVFNNSGYPAAAPYDGEGLFYWSGTFDAVSEHIVYHNNLSYGGQSGSGSYTIDDDDNRRVYSVLSFGYVSGGTDVTGQNRINSDRFYDIQNRISDNSPSTPDLIPLNCRVSTTSIAQNEKLPSFEFYVNNYSTSRFNQTMNVSLYISTNNIISTADRKLGSYNFTTIDLDPKQTTNAFLNTNSLPTIPLDLPPGEYWLGVIIENTDANTSNNVTNGFDAYQINVYPSNYACPNALPITSNGNYIALGPTGGSSCRTCDESDNAVWYRYTAPDNGKMSIGACVSSTDTRLFVYSGTCSSYTLEASADDECTSSDGNSLGVKLIDFPVIANTTYYLEWDDRWSTNDFSFDFEFTSQTITSGNCENSIILNNNPISSNTYKSETTIQSGGTINANTNVIFEAAQSITLSPGFHAQVGCSFAALIKDCEAPTFNENNFSNARQKINNALTTIPEQLQLTAYPNPFSQQITIAYDLSKSDKVSIKVYDFMGKEVARLENGFQEKGTHQIIFKQSDLSSGTYFVQVRSGQYFGWTKIVRF